MWRVAAVLFTGCLLSRAQYPPPHQLPQPVIVPLPAPLKEFAPRTDFTDVWNEWAIACNELAKELNDTSQNVWPVKKAKRCERAFEKLRKHPAWRAK